jgi:gliding motility-associated-like protein
MVMLFLTGHCWSAQAQVFTLSGGNVVSCNGALLDSGGEGGPGYSNNESLTVSVCPDQPGQAISLNTVIFNLSTAGSAPQDALTVYDGPDTGSPVLGTFDGNAAPGILSASFGNTSGCLTLVFTSNEQGTGTIAFAITCSVPCDPPTATAVMSEAAPAMICQGEVMSFDGSASTAAGGQNIVQYIWDFGDGVIDSTSGALVDHVFQGAPGEHIVHLQVEDGNGCVNTNAVDLQVFISTTPLITGMDPQTICQGETALLDADAAAVMWTGQPVVDFGEGLLLPDQFGVVFTSELTIDQFSPGQTLTNTDDLISICFEMEHSFIGDFVLELTSPTGQTVVLHQQGGLGTNLGEPVIGDESNPQQGVCYQYCFSPTATNGTWVDNAGSTTLPAGTYESLQPFSNLLGSSLNGTWNISFTDLWQIDNGFICSWSLQFDPSILPDVTAYSPVLDITDADSVFWSGPDQTPDASDPTVTTASPMDVGPHVYTFTVTDNFGCSYDSSLTVTVTPAAVFNATATLPAECGDPVQLGVTLTPPLPQGVLVYQWSPATGLSNPNIPYPLATPAVPTWYVLTVVPAGHPLCGMRDSVLVNPITFMESDSIVVDALCHADGTGSIEVVTTGNGGPWNYVWTDDNGTVVRTTNASMGDIFLGSGGTYQVLISEGANGNGCVDSITAFINEPPPVEITFLSDDTLICRTGSASLVVDAIGGSGLLTPRWSSGSTGSPYTPSPLITTTYAVWGTDPNNCSSDTLSVEVAVNPALDLELLDTATTCPDVDLVLAPDSAYGGDGDFMYDWGQGFSPEPTFTINTHTSQQVCVTLTDGCETPDVTQCIWVSVTPLPDLLLSADTILGCDPFAVRFNVIDTTNGATVDWSFGDGLVVPGPAGIVGHSYTDPGQFDVSVVVHWPNGCDDDTTIANMITVAAVPSAEFTWTPQPPSVLEPEVQFIEQAGPYATSYAWDFAGLGEDTAANPIFLFPADIGNTYPVQLIVTNYLGCADTAVRNVEVIDQFLVFVPNAFTPDGDGVNEVLFVQGRDIATEDYRLVIFDRWGEKIYESTDRSEGWDGSYSGSPVQDGVYAWRLNARSAYTGQPVQLLGHVTVVR